MTITVWLFVQLVRRSAEGEEDTPLMAGETSPSQDCCDKLYYLPFSYTIQKLLFVLSLAIRIIR